MSNLPENRPAIDVIVCVHNSPEDVRICLESAVASLGEGDRLIIVDDGSAEETMLLCQEVAGANERSVKLVRRPAGSGFCRAANAGLRESTAEIVVLLNSDTITPPGWLDRIHTCMSANWQIGIVGPLSNAGGWQSIPEYLTGGPPNNLIRRDAGTLAQIQSYCETLVDLYDYPILEQINGFCMALSRELLDTVGLLDEEHFPKGYGEEIDLTFRAQDAGFLCAVALDCFVYHGKTKSYSVKARNELSKAGRVHLDRIHGAERVYAAVVSSQQNPILAAVRKDASAVFKERGWLL